jgi:hypothetical protein
LQDVTTSGDVKSFKRDVMTITVGVKGKGHHTITRTLITPLVLDIIGDGALLWGEINTYKIECSGCEMALVPVTWWLAYGHGVPATAIAMTNRQAMPFAGKIILTAVPK